MLSSETVQLMAFIVAVTVSMASMHMGLVRIDASKIEHERSGVLIVISFSGIVLISVLSVLITNLLLPASSEEEVFLFSWVVPVAILVVAIANYFLNKKKIRDRFSKIYYNASFSAVILASLFLLHLHSILGSNERAQFFCSIAVALLVVFVQVFRSAVRFAKS